MSDYITANVMLIGRRVDSYIMALVSTGGELSVHMASLAGHWWHTCVSSAVQCINVLCG